MTRLLVVSDIHATCNELDKDETVSWMSTLPVYNTPERNPFKTIPNILAQDHLKVDYLICPGDLADCADPHAQQVAWENLIALKEAVGASRIIATVGNHDVDSRLLLSDFDPKSNLQSLTPPFPGFDETECDFFWSRNFVIITEGNLRFVVINSCAFHGVHSDHKEKDNAEFLHGRVSEKTTASIVSKISEKVFPLNIIVVHHHFYKNEEIFAKDWSVMEGGSRLLTRLAELSVGPWFIIHGHQHYPDIFYAAGGGNSPTIFSAGSMSRRLTGALTNRALNQVYHIDLPVQDFDRINWKPCGSVKSWHWLDQVGWRKTLYQNEAALVPYGSGFGCRKDSGAWLSEIKAILEGAPGKRLLWEQLINALPTLSYVLPADLRPTLSALKASHGGYVFYDDDGSPGQVGLK